VTIIHADCLEALPVECDAVVTDPPYGLSFMGKKWDYDVPSVEIWKACLRSLKPGGHLLAFAGTRTQHRMAVNIEDAGFEIRDMIAWVYGSGFPKSLDVSKAIDKAAGVEREVVGTNPNVMGREESKGKADGLGDYGGFTKKTATITAPATPAARQWNGWGTALKPALEPITIARKPLEGTVAENVLAHGAGAINIDGCRVGFSSDSDEAESKGKNQHTRYANPGSNRDSYSGNMPPRVDYTATGRWPANLIHDGSEEVLAGFPKSSVTGKRTEASRSRFDAASPLPLSGKSNRKDTEYTDSGSAARFFYCAKASKAERDAGLEGFEPVRESDRTADDRPGGDNPRNRTNTPRANHHPTVKPVDLMRYLVTLVCREGGTVLDPFMGSGTTGIACIRTGRKFIGIERDARYFEIAKQRLEAELRQGLLPLEHTHPPINERCRQPSLLAHRNEPCQTLK
jgi:site-specific DNA-methyltransferase (adenine-specific)